MAKTGVALTPGQPRHLFMGDRLVHEGDMLLVQLQDEKQLKSVVQDGYDVVFLLACSAAPLGVAVAGASKNRQRSTVYAAHP